MNRKNKYWTCMMNLHFLINAVHAELNMYPYNSTLFSLSLVENEQADAGQGDRARLARLNSQARRGIGKNSCFSFQLTTTRIGNHTRLSNTLLKTLTIQTYRHMYIPQMHLQGLQCLCRTSIPQVHLPYNIHTNSCVAAADAGPSHFRCIIWIDSLLTKVFGFRMLRVHHSSIVMEDFCCPYLRIISCIQTFLIYSQEDIYLILRYRTHSPLVSHPL